MAAHSGPKSLRDLARKHNRFLVSPPEWTSRHLDLVGCRFEDVATTPVYGESTQNDRTDGGQKSTLVLTDLTQNERNKNGQESCPEPLVRSDAELFATDWFPETKRRRLINILLGDDGPFAHTR